MATVVTEPVLSGSRRATRVWPHYGVVLLAIAGAFLVSHWLRPQPAFPYDDPYITLHSAQVLHTGSDRNYPGVSALFGATSAPFLGLVSLLLFVLPPLQALNTACWIGVLLYALGLVYMARSLGIRARMQWLLVLIGLFCAPIPVHWLNGLETSFGLAGVTWTLAFAARDRYRSWLAAALAAGVSASIRPDLLPFALILVLFLISKILRPSDGSQRKWLPALALVAAVLIPLALCAACYLHATGSPFPLTGVAKRYFFAEDHAPFLTRIEDLSSQMVLFAVAIGPLILVLPRMARFALGRVLLAVMALFVAALFVQFPGQFAVNELRYPVVLIPMLLWGLGTMLASADGVRQRSIRRLMYISAVYSLAMLPLCYHFYRDESVFFEVGPRQVTPWCVNNLPPDASILVHDAGYLAYSSKFRTIDFVGLKTPSAIPLNREYTWPTAGRDRARVVATIARQSGSHVLILNSHWPPVVTLPDELQDLGWHVDLLHVAGAFRIYRLTAPAS